MTEVRFRFRGQPMVIAFHEPPAVAMSLADALRASADFEDVEVWRDPPPVQLA